MSAAARPQRFRDAWRIRWIDHTGKRCSAVVDTYVEAEREIRHHQVEADEIRAGMRAAPPPEKSFADLCDYWREHRLPGKRSGKEDRRLIARVLQPHFGPLCLREITTECIDAFVAQHRAKAPRTVRNYLALLSVMLRGALRLKWLAQVPTIEKPRVTPDDDVRQPWLTREKLALVIDAAKRKREPVVFVFYVVAAYTGMRAGELAGLRWSDVDLTRRTIHVQRSFNGPTKTLSSRRFVPIVDVLLPVLKAWKEKCPTTDVDLVFPSTRGTMFDKTSSIFRETLYRVLDDAGFERPKAGRSTHVIHFHSFRHSFACNWRLAGGSLDDLVTVLGHTSRTMTLHYASLGNYTKPEHFAIFGSAAE